MTTATLTSSSEPQRSTALHATLWGAQALLGLAFFFAGFTKLTRPFVDLNTMMPWTLATGEPLARFIGASELLGALGLLLPSLTRIKPRLTALAGAGLVTVMLLAAIFHASRGELTVLPANFVLGSLAAFVAWGRFKKAPIEPR